MGKHVVVIGAGPVGIEMALVLIKSGHYVTLVEQGQAFAANMQTWKHVSLFSPNKLNMSSTGREVLREMGVSLPNEEAFPAAETFISEYLSPLVKYLEASSKCTLLLSTTVLCITRQGLSKSQHAGNSSQRKNKPFLLLLHSAVDDAEKTLQSDIVIDASGTYSNPNYMGPGGMPAIGERRLKTQNKIHYSIPSPSFAPSPGCPVAVIGSGASAITTLKVLSQRGCEVVWITRTPIGKDPYNRVSEDPLPQRDSLYALGNSIARGSASSAVRYLPNVDITRVEELQQNVAAPCYELTLQPRDSASGAESVIVNAIFANVGYHPDTSISEQLQVHYCYATDGPMKLAAAMLASGGGGSGNCLSQVAQGKETLRSPEPDFYIIGMKSYGRGSSFLMRLGYEQVQHVMQLIRDDHL